MITTVGAGDRVDAGKTCQCLRGAMEYGGRSSWRSSSVIDDVFWPLEPILGKNARRRRAADSEPPRSNVRRVHLMMVDRLAFRDLFAFLRDPAQPLRR